MKDNYLPKISIITISFNQGLFINQCIQSVLSQTYKNWELIIIDDCSTDNTKEILNKYKNYLNIKIYIHKKNHGITLFKKTYDEALSKATGDLVAMLDADDFWPNNKLATQKNDFFNKKILFSYGSTIMTDKKSLPIKLISYFKAKKNQSIYTSTTMFRKNSLLEIGGFKTEKKNKAIDLITPTTKALLKKNNFIVNNQILGYYRKHSGSLWYKTTKDKHEKYSKYPIIMILRNMYYYFLFKDNVISNLFRMILNTYFKIKFLFYKIKINANQNSKIILKTLIF